MNRKPRWLRLREAAAVSSAAALERGGTGAGIDNGATSSSGDGDLDDTPCQTCDGTGIHNGTICETCNGSGSQMKEAAGPTAKCPTCDGDGKIRGGQMTCPDCHGSGKVPATSPLLKESGLILDFLSLRNVPPAGWFDDGSLREATVKRMAEKDYSTATRIEFAKAGKAIPIRNDKGDITGGAYPINDGGDVQDAVQAFGHNATAEVKAHIIKNARKVGATDKIPDAWKGKSKESADLEGRLRALEEQLAATNGLREARPDHLNQAFGPITRVKNSKGQDGYEITLIREGKGNEDDGNWYPGSAIKEMCESGRAEGMQAYANHPTLTEEEDRPERDVRELIGTHTDVRYMEESGAPKAKSVFVPITTDEHHPHYGWVTTLAEAAVRNQGPQPLVGWSLYGLSAGDVGARPDGTEGRIATLIMPTSGDMVTNAGAGGEFARRLMMESAWRSRTPHGKEQPMTAAQYKQKVAEATKRLREAGTDEARTAAYADLDALQKAEIDATPPMPNSIEALAEADPKLVESLRESAKREAAADADGLKTQLADTQAKLTEAEKYITGVADIRAIADVLREAGVTEETDTRYFLAQARARNLREAADIKEMVETERAYHKAQETRMAEALQKQLDLPEVEGVIFRRPESGENNREAALSALRESGVPVKKETAAA